MKSDGPKSGEEIAIVGMAVNVPGAENAAAFWENLRSGVRSIDVLDEAELLAAGESAERMRKANYVPAAARMQGFDTFDPEFFGFSPKDAAILDPQHRKFLEVSWEAMEQAGHPPESIDAPIGVFAGCGMGSYFYFNICSNRDLVDETGMFLLRHTGNDKDFLSTRVSHVFDLKGPSINVQTACSTSLVAVHYACQALRSGEVGMALAGGVTIELPHGRGYLFQENEILSPDGECHAFDHRAQGTVFGSGAGAVALRRLSDAIADGDHIWAVIKGSAINNDGAAKAGYLAPSVDGQSAAVQAALAAADVPAQSIGYVECHGTGTYLGDPIEVAALSDAYRKSTDAVDFCQIGSVKTNIGHLDTAAGVAGLVKSSLALHHKVIPPSLGYEAPNPAIEFEGSPFRVAASLSNWAAGSAPRRAAVNALGVGGTNAHMVLEEAPERATSEEADFPFQVMCVSGRSKVALEANARALAAHLRAHPEQDLADVAYTLKEGRRGFSKRRVLVAENHAEAADLLEAGDTRRVFTHDVLGDAPDLVFMFPGGGAQYPNMGRDLYETEPVFAEWMDRGLDHLEGKLEYDLRAIWLPEVGGEAEAEQRLKTPSVQLPLIMMVEYALAQLWLSWGVRPAALVGHSMGENTAACLAGVMSFEDCIDLVLLRGQLFDSVPPGGMLSVPLSLEEVTPYLSDDLDVAGVNGPQLTAISGPDAALDGLKARLLQDEIECQRVAIDIAAHSRMLDPILGEFRAFLAGIDLAAPTLPVLSNRTGAELTAEQAVDPEYWVQQLRQTVHFADCIETLAAKSDRAYLEVGPGKALSSLAQMNASVKPAQVISSLRHPEQEMADDAYFLGVIGRLWAVGIDADWDQIWGEARRNRVVLPTYAFQRSRYFIEPSVPTQVETAVELVREEDMSRWGSVPHWRPALAGCEIDPTIEIERAEVQVWLVFSDGIGVSGEVEERLRAAGHDVITVVTGDQFSRVNAPEGQLAYCLAPEQGRDGYDALFADLVAEGKCPTRIAHFWLLTQGESHRPGSSMFDRNQEQGFYSLIALAQAASGAGFEDAMHLSAITNGAVQVRDEPLWAPEKAMISGAIGVLPREFPNLTCSSLDIEVPVASPAVRRFWRKADVVETSQGEVLRDRLLEELLAEPANCNAALRGAKRFELGYRAAELVGADDGECYRKGGTYLITGGFGGIGLTIAETLLRDFEANVILVSRGDVPDRDTWTGYLARHAPWDATSQKIEAIQRLEALGGQLWIESADSANSAQMRGVLERARAEFGGITGVIHGAGVIDDGPILAKSTADMDAVLAPKVQGLRVLDGLLTDGEIELLVLFSSTSTATRSAGQCDYVAANEFLNAYAKSRSGDATQVVAVNWGVWADVGMAAAATRRPVEASPEALEAALLRSVRFNMDGARIFSTELSPKTDWILDQHRTKAGAAILPGTGYLELVAQALAAQGGSGGYEVRDLYFLRPLQVADDENRMIDVALTADEHGYTIDVQSAVEVAGRRGRQVNATARVVAGALAPADALDLAEIAARCGEAERPSGGRLKSPQEAHLKFGSRWHVLQSMAYGTDEGLARLSLPEGARGDIDDGFLLHPGLLDLATGWAMRLIPGYGAAHLWVPVSYRSVKVHAPLPADVVSWVRRNGQVDPESGFAAFDVVICEPNGRVLIEIEEFSVKRLVGGFVATAGLDAKDVIYDDAQRPLTAAEERLAYAVSQGIQADEGAEALARALKLGQSQVFVSSLDLEGLIAQADQNIDQGVEAGQSFERPDLDGDFVAPSTEVETTLAELWSGLLGVKEVGVEDSFFDLGGHSLIAVRLFAAIKRTYDIEFPISILFEAPTIASCARLIEAQIGTSDVPETQSDDLRRGFAHLVCLNPGPSGANSDIKPLFVVAGMFGNVLNLRHLANLIGRDRPVYGIQARGLIGDSAPHETIEDAARDYLAEIRQVQADGPFLLGGFSGGGITAYEMAQQLQGNGEEAALVALLDTPLPVRPSLNRTDRGLIKLQELRRKGVGYLSEWALNRMAWEAQKRRAKPVEAAPGAEFNNRKIEMAFRGAVERYDIQTYAGALSLLRPPLDRHWAVSAGNWVSREREYVFEDNDWSGLASELRVIEVPGDHDSMVLAPHVTALAEELRGLIADAEKAEPSASVVPFLSSTAAE